MYDTRYSSMIDRVLLYDIFSYDEFMFSWFDVAPLPLELKQMQFIKVRAAVSCRPRVGENGARMCDVVCCLCWGLGCFAVDRWRRYYRLLL